MDKHTQEQEQKEEQDADGFTVVSLDESFFFYDSLVRRVWIDENKRPIVRVTGSHQRSCIFGAISMKGNRAYSDSTINSMATTFLDYLKKIHVKFQKCYLFMDKASPHYTCKKVIKYFEDNKDTLSRYIFQLLHHQRVYGNGTDMEYGQTRFACSKILCIICRFEE